MASCPKEPKNAECVGKKGPNWLELPKDLTANILHRLGVIDIVTSACLVCPLWWNICKDPEMWRTIHITNLPTPHYDSAKICLYAVRRSCGLVEDINIEYFGNDDLLEYIADSTRCLRRLRLSKCGSAISNKRMSKVAEKLSLLEELDISGIISSDTLEVIGRSCPLLKSLKFVSDLTILFGCDNDALAISKTMSGLHRLKISGKRLTNVGVLAILDGCPLLEFLDIQDCYHLVLSESLATRCRERIKDLLLPSYYCSDDDDTDDDYYVDDPNQDFVDPWEFFDHTDYWDYTLYHLFR